MVTACTRGVKTADYAASACQEEVISKYLLFLFAYILRERPSDFAFADLSSRIASEGSLGGEEMPREFGHG